MPYKKINLEELAEQCGVDLREIEQKLKLRDIIIKVRLKRGLTQNDVAKLVSLSRSRIAQIESGAKIHKMTFDVLLRVLAGLGYKYKISTSKIAA